jgi:hypothetical protein
MTSTFFFYNNLSDLDLLKRISHTFEVCDGYIIVENYEKQKNILEINENPMKNNTVLNGKIVSFKLKFEDVVAKLCRFDECKFDNKDTKYKIEQLWANKQTGGVCKTYIIY